MPNDAVDCSREAVERLADSLTLFARTNAGMKAMVSAEKMLLALLARAEEAWEGSRSAAVATAKAHVELVQVIAQRDAAVAEAARLTAEVASLRLTLGGKTFSASVPEPVGCPMPGACATVAEIVRAREMQAAWMRVIQAENTCGVTGKPCDAVRCGCSAEQEMLIGEAAAARAALEGGAK